MLRYILTDRNACARQCRFKRGHFFDLLVKREVTIPAAFQCVLGQVEQPGQPLFDPMVDAKKLCDDFLRRDLGQNIKVQKLGNVRRKSEADVNPPFLERFQGGKPL